MTSKGYFPIQTLVDKYVKVWNGDEWSITTVRQTGKDQHVLQVELSNGMNVRCTPYHRFYLADVNGPVEAKDLVHGQKLMPFKLPVIKHTVMHGDIRRAYADGTKCDNVPLNMELFYRLEWLEGFVDKHGIVDEENGLCVKWSDIDELHEVCLMLHTLGVTPKLNRCDVTMWINDDDVVSLCGMGFDSHVLDKAAWSHLGRGTNNVFVSKVVDHGEVADTFCFTEPLKNMGVFNGILAGNCIEIIQYSSPSETAVCNLASLGLPMFVRKDNTFDFDHLHRVVKIVTKNLNKIIDKNFYPVDKARRSNMLHRPIGIGVQGLADVFAMMRLAFESQEASALNKDIFETIYHGALEASMEIARKRHEMLRAGMDVVDINEFEQDHVKHAKYPGAYVTFEGSPVAHGQLQFDMWGVTPGDRYDWQTLKAAIAEYGVRNSLLVAPMPTASTAQILGNNESFEPFTSNVFKRKTMSGEFIVVNKYLLADLIKMNMWNAKMKDLLVLHNGSVQNIDSIPNEIKNLYKTVWEMKQKTIIDMCADRGAFVDQSQSMNLFVEDPDFKKLTSMHFYSWRKGLKCALYYLRTRPRATTQQFTVDPKLSARKIVQCTDEVCTMCSA
jgi:ribonucleotide reductase alpha subunit